MTVYGGIETLGSNLDETEPVELIESEEEPLEPIWTAPEDAGDENEDVAFDPETGEPLDADHE